jgi:hypothetical protein
MFWWHDGVLEELEVRVDGGHARVSGSARFGQVVQGL